MSNLKRKRDENDFQEKKPKLDSTEVSSILEQLDLDQFASSTTNIPGNANFNNSYSNSTGVNGVDINESTHTDNDSNKVAKKPQHSYNYSDFEQSLQDSTLSTKSIATTISTSIPNISNPSYSQINQLGMQFPFMNNQMGFVNPMNYMSHTMLSSEELKAIREECTVFVQNISPTVNWKTLKKHFEQCGYVDSAVLPKDSNSNNKGYGYINFLNPESVENAIRMFDGTQFGGTIIQVSRKKSTRTQNGDDNITQNALKKTTMIPTNLNTNTNTNTNSNINTNANTNTINNMGIPTIPYGSNIPFYQTMPYGQPPYYGNQFMMQPSNGYGNINYGYGQNNLTPQLNETPKQDLSIQNTKSIDKSQPEKIIHTSKSDQNDSIDLGNAEIWKDNELLFKVNMVCYKDSDFFKKLFEESTKFDLQRYTSKKTFDNWYLTNKKHVRVLEITGNNSKLLSTLEKEYSLYVSSDSLKGCIALSSALHGYPAKNEIIGLFVRTSGKKK